MCVLCVYMKSNTKLMMKSATKNHRHNLSDNMELTKNLEKMIRLSKCCLKCQHDELPLKMIKCGHLFCSNCLSHLSQCPSCFCHFDQTDINDDVLFEQLADKCLKLQKTLFTNETLGNDHLDDSGDINHNLTVVIDNEMKIKSNTITTMENQPLKHDCCIEKMLHHTLQANICPTINNIMQKLIDPLIVSHHSEQKSSPPSFKLDVSVQTDQIPVIIQSTKSIQTDPLPVIMQSWKSIQTDPMPVIMQSTKSIQTDPLPVVNFSSQSVQTDAMQTSVFSSNSKQTEAISTNESSMVKSTSINVKSSQNDESPVKIPTYFQPLLTSTDKKNKKKK